MHCVPKKKQINGDFIYDSTKYCLFL